LAGQVIGPISLFQFQARLLLDAPERARRHVGPRLVRTADAVAGVGLVGFAGVLAYRAGTD